MIVSCMAWAARRALSPARLALASPLILGPVTLLAVSDSRVLPDVGCVPFIVSVLGAGVLARDRASGMEALLLARPLLRSDHVLGRWAGLSGVAAMLAVVQLALLAVVLAIRAGAWPWPCEVGDWLLRAGLAVAGSSAVLMLASALLPQGVDAVAPPVAAVAIACVQWQAARAPLPPWLGELFNQLILAAHPFVSSASPRACRADVASNAAIALVLAVAILNRREIVSRAEA